MKPLIVTIAVLLALLVGLAFLIPSGTVIYFFLGGYLAIGYKHTTS